jgi:hypothetical protein
MIPNHQQLIGLLAHADPGFVAGGCQEEILRIWTKLQSLLVAPD